MWLFCLLINFCTFCINNVSSESIIVETEIENDSLLLSVLVFKYFNVIDEFYLFIYLFHVTTNALANAGTKEVWRLEKSRQMRSRKLSTKLTLCKRLRKVQNYVLRLHHGAYYSINVLSKQWRSKMICD